MTTILDGNKLSDKIIENIKQTVDKLDKKPGLAAVIVGDNPASKVYVNIKRKKCARAGIYSELHHLDEKVSKQELLNLINKLNNDDKIHAILVQLPLPNHLDEEEILSKIKSEKDVDGFGEKNVSKLFAGEKSILPCTPKGIIEILKEYEIPIEGKHVVIVGRSKIVGKPAAILFLNNNATVTVTHSKTKDLANFTKQADILVVAVGRPNTITPDMVKEGVVVIDVGINKIDGELIGDVDKAVAEKASYITPVPGGVGTMTSTELLANTLECYYILEEK